MTAPEAGTRSAQVLSRRAWSSALVMTLVAVVVVPAWGVFDHLLEPAHARSFVLLRVWGEAPLLLCLWLIWTRSVGRRRPELLAFLVLAVVQAEIAWMVVRADHARDFYLLGFSLALYASGCVMPGRIRWTAAVVTATWLALGIALLTAPRPLSTRDLAATTFYLSTASIIGLIGHLQRDRLSTRELSALVLLEQEHDRTQLLLTRLDKLSHEDSLTQLANRRRWDTELETACTVARRTGSAVAVIFIDIDNFKQINDHYGHTGGDDTLRAVAEMLTHRVRNSDLVARIGGDEYAVLLRSNGLGAAVELAEQLRQQALRLRPLSQLSLSLSLGVAAATGHHATAGALTTLADQQLYRAKATRNAVASASVDLPVPGPGLHLALQPPSVGSRRLPKQRPDPVDTPTTEAIRR